MPAQPEIVKTAKEMFEIADIDGEDDISKAEFVSWCGSHVISQRLLASFKKVKHVESKQVRGALCAAAKPAFLPS